MFPSVITATHTHTVCYGQDEMACYLHPIICTWDVVITCTPVTVFFPLGGSYARKNSQIYKQWTVEDSQNWLFAMRLEGNQLGFQVCWPQKYSVQHHAPYKSYTGTCTFHVCVCVCMCVCVCALVHAWAIQYNVLLIYLVLIDKNIPKEFHDLLGVSIDFWRFIRVFLGEPLPEYMK